MALDDDIVFLGRIATFRILGREAMRILAISAQPVKLAAGEQLFEEGEPADCGYVVAQGAVELRGTGDRVSGGPTIVETGTLIGETAMIVETLRPSAAVALEPTVVLRIPRGVFLRTLEGEPGAAVALRDMLANRLTSTLDDLDVVRPRFEVG
jgi:CRP-like cAMP-binding protein